MVKNPFKQIRQFLRFRIRWQRYFWLSVHFSVYSYVAFLVVIAVALTASPVAALLSDGKPVTFFFWLNVVAIACAQRWILYPYALLLRSASKRFSCARVAKQKSASAG